MPVIRSWNDKLFHPLLARTSTQHQPVGPVAYDCVKVIIVRDGSALLFGEFGQRVVKVGDVVVFELAWFEFRPVFLSAGR